MWRFLLLLYLLTTLMVTNTNVLAISSKHKDLVLATVTALQRAAKFFENNVDKVNLDCIFGLRAAEGSLYDLLKHRTRHSYNKELFSSIQNVYGLLHATAISGYARLDAEGHDYSNAFRAIINTRWYYQRALRPPRKDVVVSIPTTDSNEIFDMDEETSDACMKDLMGTSQAGRRCLVTDSCWKMMTRQEGSFGYTLTHQALYFILADVIGCSRLMERRLNDNTTLEDLFTRMGTNILYQMREIAGAKGTHIPASEHDLFLEQGVVCTWLGMDRCIAERYVTQVVEWQHESGCYKDITNEKVLSTHPGMRKLQMELTLEDGCQSHTTGLLVAYLAQSLHWMLVDRNKNTWRLQSLVAAPRKYFNDNKLFLMLLFITLLVLAVFLRRKCKIRKIRFCLRLFK